MRHRAGSQMQLTAEDRLLAQHLLQKLNSLEADFKSHHVALIHRLNKETREGEQLILDKTGDEVAYLSMSLQWLVSSSFATMTSSPPIKSNFGCNLSSQFNSLDKKLRAILHEVESVCSNEEVDMCLLLQNEEQLTGLNTELMNVLQELLSLEGDDPHSQNSSHS